MSDENDLIIKSLPYGNDFLFVKKIVSIDEHKIVAEVFYPSDSFFYSSHFKDNPVVPGVIITESIGQSALVAHIYFIMGIESFVKESKKCVLTNVQVDFFQSPQFDTTYYVRGEKVFFRNNFFRTNAVLVNENDDLIAQFNGSLKVV
jgi:3-hydroxyacyl-[acyl-carrier-protein] dehydratase